jgi:hypothetical protein
LSLSESSSTPGSRTTAIAILADEDSNKPARVLCRSLLTGNGRSSSCGSPSVPPSRRKASLPGHRGSLTQETRRARLRAPSLQHRIDASMSWRKRSHRSAPVLAVPGRTRFRFDLQVLRKPGNLVVAYQQVNAPPVSKSGNTFSRIRTALPYWGITDVPFEHAPSPLHGHRLRAPPSVASWNDRQRQ